MEGKRILILGAGGMLGEAVYKTFASENEVLATDIDVNEAWLERLDVRHADDVFKTCSSFAPDYIINLAAQTDLEFCEENAEEAYRTNFIGQKNICDAAAALDIPVVYISTSSIFDGTKKSYTDTDIPNPLSIYGKSKYEGEVYTQKTLKRYFIFRASWMMGGLQKDKKFVKKIFDQLQNGITELKVVNDKFGSLTYTWDFARNMKHVMQNGKFGTYNMVNESGCSRIDLVNELLNCLKLSDNVRVESVPSDFFANDFETPRPASEILLNDELRKNNLCLMRDWQTCLREYAMLLKTHLNNVIYDKP